MEKKISQVSKRNIIALIFLFSLLIFLIGYEIFKNETFVISTYPKDGATNVPLHTIIYVRGDFSSIGQNLSSVKYKDDPTPIKLCSSGNKNNFIFTPDLLLPDREVEVTVRSGNHIKTFSFHTIAQSRDLIDLYRLVFKQFFQAQQNYSYPNMVVIEEFNINQLSNEDKIKVAKGLLAYHDNIVLKTTKGYVPIRPYQNGEEENTIVNLENLKSKNHNLKIKIETNQLNDDHYSIHIISIKENIENNDRLDRIYEVTNVNGNWQVIIVGK